MQIIIYNRIMGKEEDLRRFEEEQEVLELSAKGLNPAEIAHRTHIGGEKKVRSVLLRAIKRIDFGPDDRQNLRIVHSYRLLKLIRLGWNILETPPVIRDGVTGEVSLSTVSLGDKLDWFKQLRFLSDSYAKLWGLNLPEESNVNVSGELNVNQKQTLNASEVASVLGVMESLGIVPSPNPRTAPTEDDTLHQGQTDSEAGGGTSPTE